MRIDERPFDETHIAGTWLEQFRGWLADAQASGIDEPTAMVLASASGDGRPSARTVLLKGVDDAGFAFFTNLQSRKGHELAANPWASLVFGWHALGRQVIVTGRVEPVADADAYFATRPYGSRIGAHASRQSQVIEGRATLERAEQEARRRYPPDRPVPRPAYWGGFRVVPDAVEFWRGRPDRLHDRLRFRRGERGGWVLERLSP